jgi:hypothetical protein
VLEDWRARLILAELRKLILVASQFFEFLHSLGLRPTYKQHQSMSAFGGISGHSIREASFPLMTQIIAAGAAKSSAH